MAEPRVSGMYVAAFLESAGEVSSVFERKARNILEANGIPEVDPEEWYSIDKFVSAMNDIEKEVGEKTSEQAGIKMMEIVPAMSDFESMAEAIEVGQEPLEESYQNYSVESVGGFRYETLSNGNGKVTYYGGWEYPESFTAGIFKGMAQEVNGLATNSIQPIEPEGNEVYSFEVVE